METFDLTDKIYKDFVEQSRRDKSLSKKCYFTDKDNIEKKFIKSLSEKQIMQYIELKLSFDGVNYRFSQELIKFVTQFVSVLLSETYLAMSCKHIFDENNQENTQDNNYKLEKPYPKK